MTTPLPSKRGPNLIAGVVLVRALVLAEKITVPAVVFKQLYYPRVRYGGLLKVVAHVVELGVAAVDIRQQRQHILGLAGLELGAFPLALGEFIAEH